MIESELDCDSLRAVVDPPARGKLLSSRSEGSFIYLIHN